MKKLLMFLISLGLILTNVNAKSYYSEYGEYSDYQDDEVLESDLILPIKDKFYHAYTKWYEKSVFDDLSYEEKEDSLYTYGEYVNDISELDGIHKYEECKIYTYNMFGEYKYLVLANYDPGILELEYIFYDKENDKELIKQSLVLLENDYYIFDLSIINVPMNNVEIRIKKNSDTKLTLAYNNRNNYKKNEKIINVIEDEYFVYDDFINLERMFSSISSISKCGLSFNGKIVDYKTIYRNYSIYNVTSICKTKYYDLYLQESDTYLLDENDYVYKYKYKVRDRVDIKDEILIDSYDINLLDYIEYSSIPIDDIKVTSDLNLYVNGIYKVNYILPFKTVTKEVYVDIKDNYINLINEQNKYINEMSKMVSEANYKVDKKNVEIKEIITETNDEKKELEEKIITCNYKLEEQKEDVEIENNNVKYMSLVSLFLLLLVMIEVRKFVKKSHMKS